jgi:hypothetical protein
MTPHDLDFLSGGDGYLIDPKFIGHNQGKIIILDEFDNNCDNDSKIINELDEVTDIRLN